MGVIQHGGGVSSSPEQLVSGAFGINNDIHSLNLAAGNLFKSHLLAPDLPGEPDTAEAAG